VGVDDLMAGVVNYPMAFSAVKPKEPVVVMSHNPGTFYALCRYDCFTIAGHTHGGQVYVPGFSRWFLGSRFVRGWYHRPDHPGRMYVSRGLGTIHVPMRVCSTPELTVFDVVPA
jgi:predicted MPP superfamily phosphohydrolase